MAALATGVLRRLAFSTMVDDIGMIVIVEYVSPCLKNGNLTVKQAANVMRLFSMCDYGGLSKSAFDHHNRLLRSSMRVHVESTRHSKLLPRISSLVILIGSTADFLLTVFGLCSARSVGFSHL